MPIHVRAEAGDYAEACLLSGDPGRARRIAEVHLDGAAERNTHRGLLGYTGGEPHTPTADWELVHGTVHAAKGLGARLHVGPVATCDTFYDPDQDRVKRWSERGVLAVEMEAATLFTLASLRGVGAGCLLVASNTVLDG